MAPALRAIHEVAADLALDPSDVVPFGRHVAKVELAALDRGHERRGRLVLVSAITPTKVGEGKTTVSVALAMGLQRLGRRAAVCLREPSLGPVFGLKGGGTGGGRAQIEPADRINLHFTGDLHAVTSAHALIAAVVDNELHFRGSLDVDPRRIRWPRVVDMDDRALRRIVVGLGGRSGGVPRESSFSITAASELMAILCLATSFDDLRARVARVIVAHAHDGREVAVADLGIVDAVAVLLRDALAPNLVQTREGGPAFVHGGPFANIAHGCSSVVATELALRHADEVVTEAGFGFDLGGEKFLHLVCRQAGFWPRCVVVVATVRALREHGRRASGTPGEALERGLPHLDRHVSSVRAFGLEPLVAINVFSDDDEASLAAVEAYCADLGVAVARTTGFADGGPGAEALARAVLTLLDGTETAVPAPRFLYQPEQDLAAKLEAIARKVYGAADVRTTADAARQLEALEAVGHGRLPVCIAKTHLSLADEPNLGGLARDFTVTVTSAEVSAGAGFVVARMGDISTMPGLPRDPAARHVKVGDGGQVRGLMSQD